ncbi:MAG: DMT family transporter [Caldilineaceae bacterium]
MTTRINYFQAKTSQGVALLVSLLLIDSLHFVFARLMLPHANPFLSALFVMFIGTIEVGIFGVVTGRLGVSILKRHWPFFVAIGFCIGVSTAISYSAIALIDPGTAAILGKTSIVYGLAFGIFWLGDRFSPVQAGGALVAIIGMVIVTFQPGDYLRAGSLLIIFSTLLYSTHTALTKRYGDGMDMLNFFFYRLLFTSAFLFAIAGIQGQLALPATPAAWGLLVLAATVDVVISRTLYYTALRRLDISIFSIVLTAGPVAAILWSFLLFGVFPNPRQLVGGAVVLVGVLVVTAAPILARKRRQRKTPVSAN